MVREKKVVLTFIVRIMLLVKFSNHVSLKDKDPDERKAVEWKHLEWCNDGIYTTDGKNAVGMKPSRLPHMGFFSLVFPHPRCSEDH